MRLAAILMVLPLLGAVRAQCGEDDKDSSIAVRGEAVVTALLPLEAGPDCAAVVPRGQRLAVAALHVLEALHRLQHVPDVDVGLRIVNSCSSPAIARKALLGAFVDLDCEHRYPLGVLTGESLSRSLSGLSSGLTQAVWTLPESSDPEPQLGNALGTLLAAGSWAAADILTSSVHQDDDDELDGHLLDAAEKLADQAVEQARLRGVCARRGHAPEALRWGGPSSRARLLVGIEPSLRLLLRDLVLVPVGEEPQPQLILAPPDGMWTATTPLPRDALLLVPDVSPLRALLSRLASNRTGLGAAGVQPEEVAASVGLSDFLAVGRALLRASDLLHSGLSAFCGPHDDPTDDPQTENSTSLPEELPEPVSDSGLEVCTRLPQTRLLLDELGDSLPQLEDDAVLELLEVRPEEVAAAAAKSATFLLLRSPGPGRPLLPLAHYRGGIWTFADESLAKSGVEAVDCPLLLASGQVEWVREAWVAAVLTVAVLGTLCASAVVFFIASRILAGDILEGSATLSLLLLLGVLVSYASALPYCLRGYDGQGGGGLVLCGLRLLAAPLAHSLLLAVMLARALMLAACDHDGGLLSHVSGPLQAALCFFTVAVQAALSVQLCVLLSPAQCSWLSGPRFLLLLSYDALLLVLLCSTAPFIVSSRRNYREGAFFAATTAVLLVVWVCWVTLYLVGGHAWRDAAVGAGVTASATAVLLGVFIPRTYLMAGAMVRDKLAAQLPALARDSSITDLAFREAGVALRPGAAGTALYDSVSISGGGGGRGSPYAGLAGAAASPNLYGSRPARPASRQTSRPSRTGSRPGSRTASRSSTPLSPDGSVPRYEVPSPHKVTRF